MSPRLMLPFALFTVVACSKSQPPEPIDDPPPAPPSEPKPAAKTESRLELKGIDPYFRLNGKPTFVFGRNPMGKSPAAFDEHFRHAAAAGERFMRIHFVYSPPQEKAGEVDAGVLQSWDEILDSAEKHGLFVMPVFGVWADWNDGSNKENWHAWEKNAFNAARGGPAKSPRELFEDSTCRKRWLDRLESIVKHWVDRKCVVAWEVFSELDLVTGASEERAVEFFEKAADRIRAIDPQKRPITASQAGINEWAILLRSRMMDFIQVHPYGDALHGRLDDLILTTVRQRLETYGKPVMIGECGLDSAPPRGTLDTAERAEIGIRHAVWASIVSGAMNGRALWWQDGYDQFEGANLCRKYDRIAAPAAEFVKDMPFTGFRLIACTPSAGIKGSVVGSPGAAIGWFRDRRCEPPNWSVQPLAGQAVSIEVRGKEWRVEFIDPTTGKNLGKKEVRAKDQRLEVELPEFSDAIAIRLWRTDFP